MIQKIRNGAALAWVVACALWVLVNDGVNGLFGATILALFVFSMLSRKGGRERQDAEFDVPRFGPTDRQILCDPNYRHTYPWNIFSDRK